ncbi:hypothetical protein BRD18_05425 [Halobacteriales archaeon SW_7_71_33]|nr:MAG: hypothetical protein BRD18_05425 [Halobacteriales archaeon SW_7_71_33]
MRTLWRGLVLAAVDVTRTVRQITGRRLRVVLLAVGVLPVVGLGGYGAYLVGRAGGVSAVPAPLSVSSVARGSAAVVWVGLAVLVTVRTVGGRGRLDNDAGLLSTVPTRAVALGRVLSEAALALAWGVPVALALAVGYAVGGGGATPLVTLPLAVLATVLSAVPVGVAVGLGLRHVLTRVPLFARHKGALAMLAFLAYFGAIVTGTFDAVVGTLFESLQSSPPAWIGDVVLVGLSVDGDPLRAALVLPFVGVLLVVGVAGATVAGRRHWFADPVLGGGVEESAVDVNVDTDADDGSHARRREETVGPFDRVERALSRAVGTATAALVVLAWRRAARAPMKLLYVTYPLFGGVGIVTESVESGEVSAFLPALALLFVAWAGTVVFTLNPLGDQGATLPVTLLSRVDGRRFVAAHVLAGTLVAVPLGTAVVGGLAVAAPLAPRQVGALVVGTPLVVVLGSLFAVGVGVAVPRYDAVTVTRSTEAVVPSLVAFVVHTVYLLLATAVAAVVYEPALEPLVAALLSWLLPFGLAVDASTVGVAARVGVALALAAPLVSVWYAVGRFERVTVD